MNDNTQSTQSKAVLFYSAAGITSALCLYAALGHPSNYGFYTLTRLAVTATCILLALSVPKNQNAVLFVLWVAAVLFNPVVPLALGRELWVALDVLICPVILYAAAIASGKNPL